MCHLGMWFSGGHGIAGLMVGSMILEVFSSPNCSMILFLHDPETQAERGKIEVALLL